MVRTNWLATFDVVFFVANSKFPSNFLLFNANGYILSFSTSNNQFNYELLLKFKLFNFSLFLILSEVRSTTTNSSKMLRVLSGVVVVSFFANFLTAILHLILWHPVCVLVYVTIVKFVFNN